MNRTVDGHIEGRSISSSTYANYGCRCSDCTAAATRTRGKYTLARKLAADWVRDNHSDKWAEFVEQARSNP